MLDMTVSESRCLPGLRCSGCIPVQADDRSAAVQPHQPAKRNASCK
jgi:hypothetical protein